MEAFKALKGPALNGPAPRGPGARVDRRATGGRSGGGGEGGPRVDSAMLLCAGYGLRLAPLTEIRPKPLFPVLGRSMLALWLDRLEEAGVSRVAVNAHHRADLLGPAVALEAALRPNLEIRLLDERDLLGTGGGLKNACVRLGNFLGPALYVVNVDIATDIRLPDLAALHFSSGSPPATLAVVDRPPLATVSLGRDGRIVGFRSPRKRRGEIDRWCGAGIMVVERRTADGFPHGPSDLIEGIARHQGRSPVYLRCPDAYWRDMGTVAEYWRLNRDAALSGLSRADFSRVGFSRVGFFRADSARAGLPGPHRGFSPGFLADEPGAELSPQAEVADSVAWSTASVGPGAVVRGSVVAGRVAPGAIVLDSVIVGEVGEGALVVDSVVGPGATVGVRSTLRRVVVGDETLPDGAALNLGAGSSVALAGAGKDEAG